MPGAFLPSQSRNRRAGGKPQSHLRLAWPSFVWECQLLLWVGWSKSLAQPLLGPSRQSFYGSGIMLTGVAIHTHQLWLLYLAYGVIGGLGLGSGYVTPVSTIIRWFPDKRGLATGLAIMGFGFAALLTGPIAQQLMSNVGLSATFYVLAPSTDCNADCRSFNQKAAAK